MLKSILFLGVLSFALSVRAEGLQSEDCSQASIDLTSVESMRTYAKGSIKVFSTDTEEPAAGAFGLAIVVLKKGEGGMSDTICRWVGGLSWVDLKSAKAAYSAKSNKLGLVLNVRKFDQHSGEFKPRKLLVTVDPTAPVATIMNAKVK